MKFLNCKFSGAQKFMSFFLSLKSLKTSTKGILMQANLCKSLKFFVSRFTLHVLTKTDHSLSTHE